MPYLRIEKPELLERVISALCYLSCGIIGLIYILLSGKQANSSFFRFHFLQSIILGIVSYLFTLTGGIVKEILTGIFNVIGSLIPPVSGMLVIVDSGIVWLVFLIKSGVFLLLVYGCIFALLGKYAEIKGLSKLVYRQI